MLPPGIYAKETVGDTPAVIPYEDVVAALFIPAEGLAADVHTEGLRKPEAPCSTVPCSRRKCPRAC